MAIFITGDTHGDFSRLLPAAFHEQRDLTKEDSRSPQYSSDSRIVVAERSASVMIIMRSSLDT